MQPELKSLPSASQMTQGYLYHTFDSHSLESSDRTMTFRPTDSLNLPTKHPHPEGVVSTIYQRVSSAGDYLQATSHDLFNLQFPADLLGDNLHNFLLVIHDPTDQIDSLTARFQANGVTRGVTFKARDLDYLPGIKYLEMCFRDSPSSTYRQVAVHQPLQLRLDFYDNPDVDFSYLGLVLARHLPVPVRDSRIVDYKNIIYLVNSRPGTTPESRQDIFLRDAARNLPPSFGKNPDKFNSLGVTDIGLPLEKPVPHIRYTLKCKEAAHHIESTGLVVPFYLGNLQDLLRFTATGSITLTPLIYVGGVAEDIEIGGPKLVFLHEVYRTQSTLLPFPEAQPETLKLEVDGDSLRGLLETIPLLHNLPWYFRAELLTRCTS